jgi:FkbM family methyltransferase
MQALRHITRSREVLRLYSRAYSNWPMVLLNVVLRGRARARTRLGVELSGDAALLGLVARLMAVEDVSAEVKRRLIEMASQEGAPPKGLVGLASLYGVKCCRLINVSDDLNSITIDVGGSRVTLYFWHNIVFSLGLNDYLMLNVEGRSVLDVGAFVGDSAIYFALRGARRVVSVEPSPWAFRAARKNVEVNGLSDRVTLLNCAVGRDEDKALRLAEVETNGVFSAGRADGSGSHEVPTCTLDSLIEKHGPFEVLKMDCEGCEYGSIPYSRRLGELREVLIEYHDGYEPLAKKLMEEGFEVMYSWAGSGGGLAHRPFDPKSGYIYAVKKGRV